MMFVFLLGHARRSEHYRAIPDTAHPGAFTYCGTGWRRAGIEATAGVVMTGADAVTSAHYCPTLQNH